MNRLTFKQIQALIWMLIATLNFFLFYAHQQDKLSLESLNYAFIKTACYVVVIYCNALWLIPFFYKRKQYISYIILSVILIVTVSWICMEELVWSWFFFGGNVVSNVRPPKDIVSTVVLTSLFFIFSFAFRYVLDFFKLEKQQVVLQKQHAEAQLNLLKAQVQPHFLFNTLNNIYYVAQLESPLTAELVEKLSNLMRYFIDEGPKRSVKLNTEFDFIKNYIDLEKIRMRYPLNISIHLNGVEDGLFCIPPMLLIPLVENVFKHGIDKTRDDNFIAIEVKKEHEFIFKVSNRMYAQQKHSSGTGLQNLRDRLDMLYGANYSLKTANTGDVYMAELIIPV